eukprot:6189478-Pleurochrysis_carterae.AAC.1
MYKAKKAVLTELKGFTLAIGQHHDDSHGLPLIMHRKQAAEGKAGDEVTCLAEEIAALYKSNSLVLEDGQAIRCNVRCCLDLAAARGMRRCRGKAACLCGCGNSCQATAR